MTTIFIYKKIGIMNTGWEKTFIPEEFSVGQGVK
jgi:hypothetical protein